MSSVRSELDAIDRYLSKNCLDDDFPTESIYGALSTFEEQEKEIATLTAKLAQAMKALEGIVAMKDTESDEWDAVERLIPEMVGIASKALSANKTT